MTDLLEYIAFVPDDMHDMRWGSHRDVWVDDDDVPHDRWNLKACATIEGVKYDFSKYYAAEPSKEIIDEFIDAALFARSKTTERLLAES